MRSTTLAELLELLELHAGAVVVSMVCRTFPELLVASRATGQPSADRWPSGIEKLVRGRFLLANHHRNNVRAQRRREGHPKPDAYTTGQLWRGAGRRRGRFLVEHIPTGRLYVRARPAADPVTGYPVRIWERWLDLETGRDVEGAELVELRRDWLRHPPQRDQRQELARQVPYRTYELIHVDTVRTGGETHQLRPDRPAYTLPAPEIG